MVSYVSLRLVAGPANITDESLWRRRISGIDAFGVSSLATRLDWKEAR